ncbi:MAG: hypothetical protein ABEJ31_06620 [Haloarculaceae archaeon]
MDEQRRRREREREHRRDQGRRLRRPEGRHAPEKFYAAVDDNDTLSANPRLVNTSDGHWFDVRDDDLLKIVVAKVAGCDGTG